MMTSSESCVHMFVYGGLVGGAVGAAVTGTLSIALYLICRKRNRQSNDTFRGQFFKQTSSADLFVVA